MKRNAAGPRRRILIVDGYNVINVRKPVRESLQLEDARRRLTDRLHDYAGYSGQQIILVYDAWLSDRRQRSVERHGALEVVFTMKGETADCYIERLCDELAEDIALRRAEVRVATSDGVEQTVVLGRGALRISSRELIREMQRVKADEARLINERPIKNHPLMGRLPDDVQARLEQMRRGKI